jgi:serine/threonine protein phosphatase PrpC
VALLPGDALLVCTDGLWELVSEAAMEACLAGAMSVDGWLAVLCAEAEAAATSSGHARDNFTAYALWIAA